MRLLDLYCGAGGAAMGYKRAWPALEIIGVDIRAQPHYPFRFIQADASTFDLDGYEIIHASPPCEGHTVARCYEHESAALLGQTISRLRNSAARLWVVENVVGAEKYEDYILCGCGLGNVLHDERMYLKRHRKFWSNVRLPDSVCRCNDYRRQGYQCIGVYGGGPSQHKRRAGHGTQGAVAISRRLMGIDWMTRRELDQAIPPSYTNHILWQVMSTTDVLT